MARNRALSVGVHAVCFCVAAVAGRAQTPSVKVEDPSVIARGSGLFATRCGIGYCHGSEGRAGRGPKLAGRPWEREHLLKVITSGVNNSLMPAFKDQLTAEEIRAVTAYVMSLGTGEPAAGEPPPAAETPVIVPGEVERGRSFFFDSSNPKRCSGCHRFRGRGGEVGPDLTSQSSRPTAAIARDILEPDARLAVETARVVTLGGEEITGVKKQETAEWLRIYDTRSLPPVLRTVYKDQIRSVAAVGRSAMPGDYGQTLTQQQLQDLLAFLKSAR